MCTARVGIEIGARIKRSIRVASGDCSAQCSDDWIERQFRFCLVTFGAGADRGRLKIQSTRCA